MFSKRKNMMKSLKYYERERRRRRNAFIISGIAIIMYLILGWRPEWFFTPESIDKLKIFGLGIWWIIIIILLLDVVLRSKLVNLAGIGLLIYLLFFRLRSDDVVYTHEWLKFFIITATIAIAFIIVFLVTVNGQKASGLCDSIEGARWDNKTNSCIIDDYGKIECESSGYGMWDEEKNVCVLDSNKVL